MSLAPRRRYGWPATRGQFAKGDRVRGSGSTEGYEGWVVQGPYRRSREAAYVGQFAYSMSNLDPALTMDNTWPMPSWYAPESELKLV